MGKPVSVISAKISAISSIRLGHGTSTGFVIDPIEKKPLNHFLPGSDVLSFGTAGCNLGCRFCQNWSISKAKLDEAHSLGASPEAVVELAKRYQIPSIAFTYNDPVIWGEFVIDISRVARDNELKTVVVTAGYITPEARPEVFRYIDAAQRGSQCFHRAVLSQSNVLTPRSCAEYSQMA